MHTILFTRERGKDIKRTTGATQSKQNSTLLSHSDLHNAKP